MNAPTAIDRFSADHGEPTLRPGQYTAYVPSDVEPGQYGGEFTLAIGPDNRHLRETGWATDYTDLSEDGKQWTPAPPGYPGKASGGGTSACCTATSRSTTAGAIP